LGDYLSDDEESLTTERAKCGGKKYEYFWNKCPNKALSVVSLCSSSDT
jgi:hypothetical protein